MRKEQTYNLFEHRGIEMRRSRFTWNSLGFTFESLIAQSRAIFNVRLASAGKITRSQFVVTIIARLLKRTK